MSWHHDAFFFSFFAIPNSIYPSIKFTNILHFVALASYFNKTAQGYVGISTDHDAAGRPSAPKHSLTVAALALYPFK